MRTLSLLFLFLLTLSLACISPQQGLNLGCCKPATAGDGESCDSWQDFYIDGEPLLGHPQYAQLPSQYTLLSSSCEETSCTVTLLSADGEEQQVVVPICQEWSDCSQNCSFVACSPYKESVPFGGGDLVEVVDAYREVCNGNWQCVAAHLSSLPAGLTFLPQGLLYGACSIERASGPEKVAELKRKQIMPFFFGIGRDLYESYYAEFPTTDYLCPLNPLGRKDRYSNYFLPQLFPPEADDAIPNLLSPYPLSGSPTSCQPTENNLYALSKDGKTYYFPSLFQCAMAEALTLPNPYERLPSPPSDTLAHALSYPVGGLTPSSLADAQGLALLPPKELEVSSETLSYDYGGDEVERSLLKAEAPYLYLPGVREPISTEDLKALPAGGALYFYSISSILGQPQPNQCASLSAEELLDCMESNNCPQGVGRMEESVGVEGEEHELLFLTLPNCRLRLPYSIDGQLYPYFEEGLAEGEGALLFPQRWALPPSYATIPPEEITFYTPEEMADPPAGWWAFYPLPSRYSLAISLPYLFSSLHPSLLQREEASGSYDYISYSAPLYLQQPHPFYGQLSYAFDYECTSSQECLSGICSFSSYSRLLINTTEGMVANSHCSYDGLTLRCPPYALWTAPSLSGEVEVKFTSRPERVILPLLEAQPYHFASGNRLIGYERMGDGFVLRVVERAVEPYGKVKNSPLGEGKVALFLPPNALPSTVEKEGEQLEVAFPISFYRRVYDWGPAELSLPAVTHVDETKQGDDYEREGPVLRALVYFSPSPDLRRITPYHQEEACNVDLNGPWDDGGDAGRWDKGFTYTATGLMTGRTPFAWCEGFTCYMGSARGFDDKCDNSANSYHAFFAWPVDIDLYKYLTLSWRGNNEGNNRGHNLGDFPLFPVCGLEEEFVLCANPLFRSPLLTELVLRESDGLGALIEYQPPLSYSPLPKQAFNVPGSIYFARGSFPSPYPLDEAKMLVLAYNGLSAEDAARICSSLTLEDFCLSGSCSIAGGGARAAKGLFAPSLLVVGDFDGDGKVGKRCYYDEQTVIDFQHFGWCEGCNAINAHTIPVDLSPIGGKQPPTVSGVYDGTTLRGINSPAGGALYDKVDEAYLPPIYYQVEEASFLSTSYSEREDLSWPSLLPPQGVLKERLRDWLRRGNVVLLFPTRELVESPQALFLFRDLAGVEEGERKDIPLGAMVVVLPLEESSLIPTLSSLCPSCLPALTLREGELPSLYAQLGLQGDAICERRDIAGIQCGEPYGHLKAIILNVSVEINTCSAVEDYQPLMDHWAALAEEISHRLGLPTIIYINSLSSSGECDYSNFFTALALNRLSLINKGVWGIYLEDISSDDTFAPFDSSFQPRAENVKALHHFLRLTTISPSLSPRTVPLGKCSDCLPKEGCLPEDIAIACSDGWQGSAGELLQQATTSTMARYRLGAVHYYTGLAICDRKAEKAYTLQPLPNVRPSAFAFCELGTRECHREGITLPDVVEALAPFSQLVCWPYEE